MRIELLLFFLQVLVDNQTTPSYLRVGFECCGLCRCEAVGQKGREAKQQTEDIQADQDDDLCNIATKFKQYGVKIGEKM